jgi:DNA-directed RNA polymerase alpha subunit
MLPVKCPCCGAHLLLCDATATPHAPKPWADDTPIHALPVSTRAKDIVNDERWDSAANALVRTNRFRTAGDVDAASDNELLRIMNIGKASLKELREAIKALKEQAA